MLAVPAHLLRARARGDQGDTAGELKALDLQRPPADMELVDGPLGEHQRVGPTLTRAIAAERGTGGVRVSRTCQTTGLPPVARRSPREGSSGR
jgi:hypothetical protein